jgi:hypothetical protein
VLIDWIRDVRKYRSRFADELLIHFYRWLIDSNAFMYEPAVKRAVHALMHKMALLFIAEWHR